MEISPVASQYVINQTNDLKEIDKSAQIEQTNLQKVNETQIEDKVTISGGQQYQSIIEQDLNSNNIQPNAATLENMSYAEAGELGSDTLTQKTIDDMKAIAMTEFLASVEEMNLPSEQVAGSNPFVDTDMLSSGVVGGGINVDSNNINININIDENANNNAPKTEQTGPAQELGINVE